MNETKESILQYKKRMILRNIDAAIPTDGTINLRMFQVDDVTGTASNQDWPL